MSIRTEQIGSTLRRAIQDVIARGLHDPRIRGLVSVTAVTVSPDLAEAYVDVSIFPRQHAELAMHGLKHSAGRIRHDVSDMTRLRRMPRLLFRLDESLKKQADVHAAIAAVLPPPSDDIEKGDPSPTPDASPSPDKAE
ncbi:MAG: 30S ribosome-binding factor RbfA [Phycisphaerales bacterium]